jgi:hypothetical protein
MVAAVAQDAVERVLFVVGRHADTTKRAKQFGRTKKMLNRAEKQSLSALGQRSIAGNQNFAKTLRELKDRVDSDCRISIGFNAEPKSTSGRVDSHCRISTGLNAEPKRTSRAGG